jgi:hypothetical protein
MLIGLRYLGEEHHEAIASDARWYAFGDVVASEIRSEPALVDAMVDDVAARNAMRVNADRSGVPSTSDLTIASLPRTARLAERPYSSRSNIESTTRRSHSGRWGRGGMYWTAG